MSRKRFIQFIKFGLVGVSNTVVSYLLNIATLFLMQPLHTNYDYIAGNLVSFFLSVLWSYYWNRRFVFRQTDKSASSKGTLLRTYISYGFTGVILNNVLSTFWIHTLGMSKYIAPLLNLIISVPINFLLNKFWAFKDTE